LKNVRTEDFKVRKEERGNQHVSREGHKSIAKGEGK